MMDATQLALEQRSAEEQSHHSKGQFLWVWGALLVMTGIEVWLAYQNMELVRMLSILMGLSLIKAGLIIGYFMHLKFEISAMKWVTMSSLVFCLAMMLVFLPDAFRILHLGVGIVRNDASRRHARGISVAVGGPCLQPGLRHVLQQRQGRSQRRPERHQPGRPGIAVASSGLHDAGSRHGNSLQ